MNDVSHEDDLDLFDADEIDESPEEKPRRTWQIWALVAVVVLLLGGGAYYGVGRVLGVGYFGDYSGDGDGDVLVHVQDGASTKAIGSMLADAGVVRSARAFVNAASGDDRIASLHPGYYVMKTAMSGRAAEARIADPASRVGNVQIQGGLQLSDLHNPDNSVKSGILSLLANASCVTLNGKQTCTQVRDLQQAAATADPAELGVPDWALPAVAKADPAHRLEGLIVAGVYDVKPGSDARELLKTVLTASAATLSAVRVPAPGGESTVALPALSKDTGLTPYQVLQVASLIEREAIASDFAKVSRVTYNRLAVGMPLQYDSTINYELDRPLIATSDADRNRAGPYNSYQNTGLPPTPISSPSQAALVAAAKPAEGTWLYFVKCDKDGNSCFANTQAEHDANVRKARDAGAF